MPIWVVYLQQRGLTLAQIGALDSVGWVLQAAAELPTGTVADVYGRKASMALGAVLLAFAMFAVQTEVFSPLFLLGYMLWGVSHTLANGADMAFLYDSLKADGLEGEYARRAGQHTAVMWTSQALAALAGGWLAQVDIDLCFTVSGVFALAAAATALTFREPPRAGKAEGRTEGQAQEQAEGQVEGRAEGRGAGYARTLREGVALAVRDPRVRYPVALGALVGSCGFFLAFVLLQPYARAMSVPLAALGPLALAARATGIAGALTADWVGRRAHPMRAIVGGLGLFAICLLLMVPARSIWNLAPLLVAALASGVVRPLLSHEVNRWVPSERRATVLSLQAVLFTAWLVVLEPGVFALAGRWGMGAGVAVMAGAYVVVAGAVLAGWRRALARAGAPGAGPGRACHPAGPGGCRQPSHLVADACLVRGQQPLSAHRVRRRWRRTLPGADQLPAVPVDLVQGPAAVRLEHGCHLPAGATSGGHCPGHRAAE